MSSQTQPDPRHTAAGIRRLGAASVIGTTIEWYDFFIYGACAALIFNDLFFPNTTPLVGTILALTTYAIGFVARPVGGVVFGHFGDRIGRKKLLTISLILMGSSTVAIGLLPTFDTIGVAAPLLLTALRLVQGLALGGEWGGAVLIIAEQAPPRRRGLAASLPQIGAPLGSVLATGTLALLTAVTTESDFQQWGWRVPFLISAVLVLVGFWIRISITESKVFTDAKQRDETRPSYDDASRTHTPINEVLTHHRRPLVQAVGSYIAINVLYYMVTAFTLVYVTTVGIHRDQALLAILVASLVQVIAVPLCAVWSDRVGRKLPALIGAVGMALFSFVFFPMIGSSSTIVLTGAFVIGLLLHSLMYGPQAAFFTELFPTRVRYTGISVGVQIASVLGGSLAPIIGTFLLDRFDSWVPIAIYMFTCAAITTAALCWAPETYRRELTDDDQRDESTRTTEASLAPSLDPN
ncbi:MAG: MFS transporter [Rhodococcus sp. (in: high G+C Gram-positive bacteria)]